MNAFADHFSAQAALYAQRRPHYPAALFAWLAGLAPGRRRAWDAGCGNGQAALGLAWHFEQVDASDPSAAQIAAARPHPRVQYRVGRAEDAEFAPASLDLICVAQALHWFDAERFHPLARRALAEGGLLAAISYGLCRVDPAVDAVYRELYEDLLGPYWPAERMHVESGYRTLPFPWQEPFAIPAFVMAPQWTLPAYLGYLRSWSAVARCLQATGTDPVAAVETRLAHAWGDPQREREVRFPLNLRVGVA